MILRLLTTGRRVRTALGSSPRVVEARAMLEIAGARPAARVSFVAEARDDDAEKLDASAGCEFVDDRIRPLE